MTHSRDASTAPGRLSAAVMMLTLVSTLAHAQPVALPPPPSGVSTFMRDGIQFSHVQVANIVGGTPAPGPLNGPVGAGSWNFGIARTELTQGAWVEFINAFNTVPFPEDQPYSSSLQIFLTGTYGSGPGMYFSEVGPLGRAVWQTTPEGAVRPAWMLGWFGAALCCNWLSNGRQTTIDALLTGSYELRQWNLDDTQTWSTVTRAPDAQYFIPTYDEWAVASFYDRNRFGPGISGWWTHLNMRERPGVGGAPGVGETSFLWYPMEDGLPAMADLLLPVGSYPGSQSPWGLLDTSGSMYEALDEAQGIGRRFAGTLSGWAAFPEGALVGEQLGRAGWSTPITGEWVGLRIAVRQLACSPADVGGAGGESGGDGLLDNNDFIAFIEAFFNRSPGADRGIAGGLPGADGELDNNDFIVFIAQFFAGC